MAEAEGKGPFSLGCCCQGNDEPDPGAGCCCRNGKPDPTIKDEFSCLLNGGKWYAGTSCDDVDCSGGGGGCYKNCQLNVPGAGRFSQWWEILSASYDRTSGNWEVVARTIVIGGYSSGQLYNNGGSNAVITSHVPAPTFGTGRPYPAGTRVTVKGTSTPPTSANCGSWRFGMLGYAVVFLVWEFNTKPC